MAVVQGLGDSLVAQNGVVWAGMFYGGTLGSYDPMTGAQKNFTGPWSSPALAIPTEASDGSIWVTDHAGKVGRFDPVSESWLNA